MYGTDYGVRRYILGAGIRFHGPKILPLSPPGNGDHLAGNITVFYRSNSKRINLSQLQTSPSTRLPTPPPQKIRASKSPVLSLQLGKMSTSARRRLMRDFKVCLHMICAVS